MTLQEFDNSFLIEKIKLVAGVDEAGRGPLAGPVVAAVAVFNGNSPIAGINDSKKLNDQKRNDLYEKIIGGSLSYGIGIIEQEEIEIINILQASLKAMKIAVDQLTVKPDILLIDGNKTFNSDIETKTIVKGDAKSYSIAAASILAKVTRDRIMEQAHEKYPQYGWNRNKGYATKEHIEMIKKYGVTPLHRPKFLRKILNKENQITMF